jgi:hypothetical protein
VTAEDMERVGRFVTAVERVEAEHGLAFSTNQRMTDIREFSTDNDRSGPTVARVNFRGAKAHEVYDR